MQGNFEGRTLRLIHQLPQGFGRGIWMFPDTSRYRFLLEMPPAGQQWKPMIDGIYTGGG